MACSKSHLKLLKSLKDEVGEQGVVIMEDDVIPLEGADQLQERIELAKKHFPNVQNIICNDYDKKHANWNGRLFSNNRRTNHAIMCISWNVSRV